MAYWGIVVEVSGNKIKVEYEAAIYTLHFATCSTLEIANDRKIEKGRDIIWRGSKGHSGKDYKVRSALCI